MNLAKILLVSTIVLCIGCAKVLEEPRLNSSADRNLQENFDVELIPLTTSVVSNLNKQSYDLPVTKKNYLKTAQDGSTQSTEMSLPKTTSPIPYKIGTGDVLSLTRFITKQGVTDDVAQDNIVTSSTRVTADGNILFIETGLLNIEGSSISQARDTVSNALIRNGIDPRFQLEVTGFNSQTVGLIISKTTGAGAGAGAGAGVNVAVSSVEQGTALYPITEKPLTLKELLIKAGFEIDDSLLQVVTLQRLKQSFRIPISHIFSDTSPDYYLTGGDIIKLDNISYRPQFAYMMGGDSKPQTVRLDPENRTVLAEALLAEGGLLSSEATRKWEVYMLRGQAPIKAYHLDTTDPARFSLATKLELRPDDILFASTKPIYNFNTLLGLLNPLRAASSIR